MAQEQSNTIGNLGQTLVQGDSLVKAGYSAYNTGVGLYNLATTGSYLAGTAGTVAGTTAGGTALAGTAATTSALGAALPGIGLALMAGAWIAGAAGKADMYQEQAIALKEGIGNIQDTLVGGATDLRQDIEEVQDITASKITASTLSAGQKLSGGVADTLQSQIKKHGGLKTGDVETTKTEIGENIQDSMNAQSEVLLSSTHSQIESMGEGWEANLAEAEVEMDQMREDIAYAEAHDDWYDNLF